jgi:hypothetical protein
MKRILATVAALGVLGYTSLAGAALVTFSLGTDTTVNSVSGSAANPFLPAGATGFDPYYGPIFIGHSTAVVTDPNNANGAYLGQTSSITINTDLNGDGIEGQPNDVGMVGGTLFFDLFTTIGALGDLETHTHTTISGGVGTLVGDQILWDVSGAPGTGTFYATDGTWRCVGEGLCVAIGLPPGTTVGPNLPIASLQGVTGTVTVAPTLLGMWQLNAAHDTILGSQDNTIQNGGSSVSPPLYPGLPAQWYVFGSQDLGHIPEPGAFALILLGIGGIALRSRKA